MSILDASVMAAASRNEVTPSTIRNCFRHAGFVCNTESEPEEEEQVSGEDLHEVSNLFERFAQVAKISPQLSVEEYISMDEHVGTHEELTVADIASCVQQPEAEDESAADDEDVAIQSD
ncbi:hypothetical protein PoB_006989900 [Plakobranchus ocellatus]|uniref:Uncharacterized protein n=1 Tax=Plakobranchus ocellatus TaxID=259542 RepID=A0AAV4DH95_9GAST|nr:hypothetical protein PoB_006989900 [Plakobranchus ocellatus]